MDARLALHQVNYLTPYQKVWKDRKSIALEEWGNKYLFVEHTESTHVSKFMRNDCTPWQHTSSFSPLFSRSGMADCLNIVSFNSKNLFGFEWVSSEEYKLAHIPWEMKSYLTNSSEQLEDADRGLEMTGSGHAY